MSIWMYVYIYKCIICIHFYTWIHFYIHICMYIRFKLLVWHVLVFKVAYMVHIHIYNIQTYVYNIYEHYMLCIFSHVFSYISRWVFRPWNFAILKSYVRNYICSYARKWIYNLTCTEKVDQCHIYAYVN